MNGHPTPRRTAAGPHLLFLLLLALVTCSLALAGCGADTGDATASEGVIGDAAVSAPGSTAPEPAEGTFPVTLTDDLGNSVTVSAKPTRIVSAAPSNTEILFALGVGDRVVGVTSLDDYPSEVVDIEKVGDYTANTEAIMALSPDLVLGYSGGEEALAPVQEAGAAVLIFNPTNLEGIYANVTTVGAATGATSEAAELIESIRAQIEEVTQATSAVERPLKVFYALDNTLWTCGPGSFVDELLALANVTNVGAMQGADAAAVQAYYQFSAEQLVAADPDVILLPTASGYTSADEFTGDTRFAGLTAVKEGHVYLIDDTTVTRPGPRIGEGLKLLAETIYPEVF